MTSIIWSLFIYVIRTLKNWIVHFLHFYPSMDPDICLRLWVTSPHHRRTFLKCQGCLKANAVAQRNSQYFLKWFSSSGRYRSCESLFFPLNFDVSFDAIYWEKCCTDWLTMKQSVLFWWFQCNSHLFGHLAQLLYKYWLNCPYFMQ